MRDHGGRVEGIRLCPTARTLASPTAKPAGQASAVRGGTFVAWGKLQLTLGDRLPRDYYGSYGRNSWLAVPPERGLVIGLSQVGTPSSAPNYFWKTANVDHATWVPAFLDGWWSCAWPKENDTPPHKEGQNTAFPVRLPGFDAAFLHQPAQQIRQRSFYGRVRAQGWAEGVVDVEMASELQHGGPLDESRRRATDRLA